MTHISDKELIMIKTLFVLSEEYNNPDAIRKLYVQRNDVIVHTLGYEDINTFSAKDKAYLFDLLDKEQYDITFILSGKAAKVMLDLPVSKPLETGRIRLVRGKYLAYLESPGRAKYTRSTKADRAIGKVAYLLNEISKRKPK